MLLPTVPETAASVLVPVPTLPLVTRVQALPSHRSTTVATWPVLTARPTAYVAPPACPAPKSSPLCTGGFGTCVHDEPFQCMVTGNWGPSVFMKDPTALTSVSEVPATP